MTNPSLISGASSVGQAVWHHYHDAATGQLLPGIGVARIVRFSRLVRLDSLTVRASRPYGPAHLRVLAWDQHTGTWTVLTEHTDLLICREAPFAYTVALDGAEVRTVQVQCLRHHPVPPNGYDQWANPYNPPFSLLDQLEWQGEYLTAYTCDLPVQPRLHITGNHPVASGGMSLFPESDRIGFASDAFAATFSLRRPLLLHLGWDSAHAGKATRNLLYTKISEPALMCGPLLSTLDWDCGARQWGGEVSIEQNIIRYANLSADPRVRVYAAFEVRSDGMDIHLCQRVHAPVDVIASEAWRFAWNARAASTATLGLPRQDDGPTGIIDDSVLWAAPGYGTLSGEVLSDGSAYFRIDSWRAYETLWAGFSLADLPCAELTTRLMPGVREATLKLRVTELGPRGVRQETLHSELRRNWAPGLMFRPELAGFSNNALSTNCHMSQTGVTDLAAYTADPAVGPRPIELARHTATMALKHGRGYGDWRELYQDSNPSIPNATGRVHQVAPDAAWLADVWPYIRMTTERVLSKIDDYGLVVAPCASGNLGDSVHPSNAWDTIYFGHYDAYSNVETYRALRNAAVLARDAGDAAVAARVQAAADTMQRVWAGCFYDAQTGWFGSWRSKDGMLHNYGHLCINAAACLYGLVPPERAQLILRAMEAERIRLGMDNFRNGVPSALAPIPRDDQMNISFSVGSPYRPDGADTFGIYCNGCLTLGLAYYYVRAMKVFGFDEVAEQMATEILEGHALGRLVDGVGTGVEFYTPEGLTCGYEGAYVLQFPTLLAIAQNQGLVTTFEPEFWPT